MTVNPTCAMADLKIRGLLCHAHVDLACKCWGSLIRYCRTPVQFIIHDDGTLTEDDRGLLSDALGDIIFIDRSEADDRVIPLLEEFPACLEYRNRHPLGLKLFDVRGFHDCNQTFYFCDSDVLFFKPFEFPKVNEDTIIYMKDYQNAYSLRSWHIQPLGSVSIIGKVNTGLIAARLPALESDLDLIESFLGNGRLADIFAQRPQWLEQTSWAVVGTQLSAYHFDEGQVSLATDAPTDLSSNQVALHFVSPVRHTIDHYLKYQCDENEAETVLKTHKARKASTFSVFRSELARRLKR